MSHAPWRHWYHCNGNTYGTWLPGDPRGFRTRSHREHVEGDYRTPPAKDYAGLQAAAAANMDRPPVRFGPYQRDIVCRAFAASLLRHPIELIDLCVGATHWHLLARFTPEAGKPRVIIGRAKTWANHALRDAGCGIDGGAWARGCRCLPIRDRSHQVNVTRYIRRHVEQGAAVWSALRGSEG